MANEAKDHGKRPMMDITGESPEAKRPVISDSPDVKATIEKLSHIVELPDDNAPNHVWFKAIFAKLDEFQKVIKFQSEELSDIKGEVKQMQDDFVDVKARLTLLEDENVQLKLENQAIQEQNLQNDIRRRELNLIFEGIIDCQNESPNFLYRKFVDVLNHMEVFNKCGQRVAITRIQRLGPPQRDRCRPVLCNFLRYDDVQLVLRNRGQLPNNVYAREDFPDEIEERRRILRPIFNRARKSTKYKGKCRLTRDKLVILGQTYTVRPKNNLDKLPPDLNPRKSAERENENVLAFFTQGSPFSNFHSCKFVKNNTTYTCAEQYIQAMKAQLFNDDATHYKIMHTSSPYEMKYLGGRVSNFVGQAWVNESEKIATDACLAKFTQNGELKRALLETGSKTLAEASYDKQWGVGLSLDDEALLDGPWTGNNLLGKVLMNVREHLQ